MNLFSFTYIILISSLSFQDDKRNNVYKGWIQSSGNTVVT
jgi:hypothetical protein